MNLRRIADYLDTKIYYMLLFTVAVIPLHQELAACCVAATFLAALLTAVVRGRRQPCVLQKWQQGVPYLLLGISLASVYFSLDSFLSFWNWVYAVGQYAALTFVLLRYGRGDADTQPIKICEAGNQGCCPGVSGKLAYLWRKFSTLPRPLQLIGAFLAVSILVSGIGIAQKVFGVTAEGVWVDPQQFPDIKVRVFSTLVNPNILAGYLVLVIAYAAAFFQAAKGSRCWRLAFLSAGVLAAVCLLYTYSRGNWVACAAVLLAFCVLFCRKAFIPVLGGGAAALALGGQTVLHRLASISSGEDTSAALRLAYLKSTRMIIEDFPLGVGWYGYRFVYPEYNYYLADTSVIMYHCHNIFLNVLSELGWHGLLAFLVVWWGVFLRTGWRLAFQGRSLRLRAMGRGYVLASVGIAVGGLTDHVYFNTQMGLLFWLLGGLTMLCWKLNAYERQE